MPIGIIINALSIVIGGILGAFVGHKLSPKFKFSVSVMHESSSPELKISSKLSGVPNSAACTGTVAVISATVRNTLARRFPLLCLFLYIFTSILQKRPNIKYAGRSLCIPNHSKTSSDCPAFDQNRHNLLICK